MRGMMLHQDGSKHFWLAGQPALDLIITLDDATSELYSAILVDEEGTLSSLRWLVEVIERHGLFMELYIDSRQQLLLHPRGWRRGLEDPAHPCRPGARSSSVSATSLAYSPRGQGPLRARLPDPAGPPAKELALAGISTIEGLGR